MGEGNTNPEQILPKKLLTPDDWAVKIYDMESKKPGGGSPQIKEAVWLSGLKSMLKEDKEKLIERVVATLNEIPEGQLSLKMKKKLVDRVCVRNSGFDKYTIDASTFDPRIYRAKLGGGGDQKIAKTG